MSTPYYEDDLVQLWHGDCLELTAWLEGDVLVTDPPYGRNWRQGGLHGARRPGGQPKRASDARDGIAGDKDTTTRDAALALWGDGPAVVFGDLMLAPPTGMKLVAIYRKPLDAGARGAIAGVRRDVEAIYFRGAGWGSGIGGRSSVFATRNTLVGSTVGVAKRSGGHPHAKPTDVLEDILTLCPPGVIADPFAGSGSILVAARQLGRRAIGVEVEERYCEMAARRLSQGALPLGDGGAA